jgi:hypothetical protein
MSVAFRACAWAGPQEAVSPVESATDELSCRRLFRQTETIPLEDCGSKRLSCVCVAAETRGNVMSVVAESECRRSHVAAVT